MAVGNVTVGGGNHSSGGYPTPGSHDSLGTQANPAVAMGVSRLVPPPPRGGQLLRLSQLTKEELEKLQEEWRYPLYLPRKLEKDMYTETPLGGLEDPSMLPQTFRPKERMRTNSVALVMCLNLGVDPPDVVKISPCARMECWIDPVICLTKMTPQKVLDQIGSTLQKQYERWQLRARYKQALDPTFEDVKKLCVGLRKGAKDERVLFHYNGHGVPKPTNNGEIWVFNKQYTQYIPLSLYDLQQWMGSPSIYVYDCSGAGILLSKFQAWSQQHQKDYEQQLQQHQQLQQQQQQLQQQQAQHSQQHQYPSQHLQQQLHQLSPLQQQHQLPPHSSMQKNVHIILPSSSTQTTAAGPATQVVGAMPTLPPPPNFENCIQLAACRENEILPMDPSLPADIFTACLTTPINMALRCYVLNNSFKLVPGLTLETIENIPGSLIDRRTMLGELNWIFTAITDTIAWNVLPKSLFQKLFRQDLLVASLFRNFLLAERVMRIYDCNPQSSPALPKTFQHPMWQAWDLALDACLRQLPDVVSGAAPFCHSTFFAEQLTAFEVWLRFGSLDIRPSPPEQLPIVLQVLLSQVHRTRALELLGQFLDLGPWAVAQALSVGIFPYILKLLQSSSRELRPLLVFIWTKILAVDCSYQQDLVRENSHKYFLAILQDSTMLMQHRTMAAFILSCLCANGHHKGQKACMQNHVVAACTELLSGEPLTEGLKKWLCILLGRLWDGYCDAKWLGIRSSTHERLSPLLRDPSPEVRAAAVFALGTLLNSQTQRTDHADNTDAHIGMMLVVGAQWDGSPLVRLELVAALQWLLCVFDSQYVSAACQTLQEEGRGANNNNNSISHNNNSLGSPIQRQHGRVKSATQFFVTSIVDGVRATPQNSPAAATTYQGIIATEQKLRRISSGNSLSSQSQALAAGGCLLPANTLHSQHAVTWKLLNALATVDPHESVSDWTAKLVRMYREKAEAMVAASQRRPSRDHLLRASPTSSNISSSNFSSHISASSNNSNATASMNTLATNVSPNTTTSHSEPSSPSGKAIFLPRKNFDKALPQLREDRLTGSASGASGSGTDARAPDSSITSSTTLNNGEVNGPGSSPASSLSGGGGVSGCSESSYQLVATPVITTSFLDTLTKQFQKPCLQEIAASQQQTLTTSDSSTALPSTIICSTTPESDRDSQAYSAGEFRLMRNAGVRRHALHTLHSETWRGAIARAEEHQFSRKPQAGAPPVATLFHPFEPLLFVADTHQVTVLNTERMAEVDVLEHPTTRVGFGSLCARNVQQGKLSSMTLVNAHHDRCLLFTASTDGAVRAWANTYSAYYNQSPTESPEPVELVTAFNCALDAAEMQTTLKCAGILLDWDQARNQLVTCGDLKVVRIWDMAAERRLLDITLDADSPVRCVSLDRTAGGSLLAVGTIDGYVKLYDRRKPPGGICRPVLSTREHLGQVVGVHLNMSRRILISASVSGHVRYWQLPGGGSNAGGGSSQPTEGCRQSSLPNQDLTCMVVHPFFPGILACGTQTANVVVQEESGPAHILKPHTDWFSGQKTSPINAIAFHPYKMCLATAYQDSTVSLYQRRRS
ncbi:regulatory-associated protein of mTOR-like isoform X2 [Varroa jacobsoni]|uniref:regulatory-associated protein of mTOR-like isoform X2 n=1 Tax=Varroa jacobsoni TaxID=62625 RepID=UPI000BF71FDC|nr:regulatory-associated protein of mTOR-like isoform X2 [Varroa jacobsoni]